MASLALLSAACGDPDRTEVPRTSATTIPSVAPEASPTPDVSLGPQPTENAPALVARVAVREPIQGPLAGGANDLVTDGRGQAWIAFQGRRQGDVQSIDLGNGKPDFHARVGWSPEHLALGDRWLWVTEGIGDGSHDPADPDQNRKLSNEVDLAIGSDDPVAIVAVDDGAWILTTSELLKLSVLYP